MVEIVQVSDFHYGSGFKDELFDNVVEYLKKNTPDAIICTGDLVHKGRKFQFEPLLPYLETLESIAPLMCIPGNHDVKNSGLLFFEHLISPRRSTMIFDDKDTIIIGACSANDDLSKGEIGDEKLEWIARQFHQPLQNRILALHHHLIALPNAGRKLTTVYDAGEILELSRLFEVDVVLMGHRHISHAYVIEPTSFIYCGTTTSHKMRANDRPSFNRITLDEGDLEVHLINSEDLEEELLLKRENGRTKYVRPRKTRIEHILGLKIFQEHY